MGKSILQVIFEAIRESKPPNSQGQVKNREDKEERVIDSRNK